MGVGRPCTCWRVSWLGAGLGRPQLRPLGSPHRVAHPPTASLGLRTGWWWDSEQGENPEQLQICKDSDLAEDGKGHKNASHQKRAQAWPPALLEARSHKGGRNTRCWLEQRCSSHIDEKQQDRFL